MEEGEDEIPIYSIAAKNRGPSVSLDLSDLQRGHVVVDGVWYPIDPPAGTEVAELIGEAGGKLGPR